MRADKKIFIEVSDNLLSQVISRAFAIILREVYGYKGVYLYQLDYDMPNNTDKHATSYEAFKLIESREFLDTYVFF